MPTGKNAQPNPPSATLLLASVAGCVDAIGYATLFRLFTAHMTGNTVGFASRLVNGELANAAWHAFPIPVFVAGAMTGAVVARTLKSRMVTIACEALALLCFIVVARDAHGARLWLAAALPAFAMGMQAVTFRRCGDTTVQTTFLTGMLAAFADASVAWLLDRKSGARARIALGIWCSYVTGAIIGSYGAVVAHAYATVAPLAGLAITAALIARRRRAVPARDELSMRA